MPLEQSRDENAHDARRTAEKRILGVASTAVFLAPLAAITSLLAERYVNFVGLLHAEEPSAGRPPQDARAYVSISIVSQPDAPLVKKGEPGTEGIQHGFETGCVLKLHGVYHWFTAEFPSDPLWVKTRLAHWISPDGRTWKRLDTLYESSGNFDGTDVRAALFAPMPIYDEKDDRWNLFYSSARCKPNTATEWLNNYEMRIWRAVSKKPGREGVGGPYEDVGVVMQPGKDSDKWEGLQGVDSFFPYRVGNHWCAFYGSAHTERRSVSWLVGLAAAPELAGPWRRLPELSPVVLDGKDNRRSDVENPIVFQLHSGRRIAVFDVLLRPCAIGYTVSDDGLHWSRASYIDLKRTPGLWVHDLRTPLGLIEEPNGSFTCFYTGYGTKAYSGYGCLGSVTLKLKEEVR
jgi:hypothetical protein